MKDARYDLTVDNGSIKITVVSNDRERGFLTARAVGDVVEIELVEVVGSFRRLGVGSSLVARLRKYAADEGFDAIYAESPPELLPFFAAASLSPVSVLRRGSVRVGARLLFDGCDYIRGGDFEAVLMRQSFVLPVRPIKATLRYTALGFADHTINGKAVTPDLMTPVFSDYEPRDLAWSGYPLHDHGCHTCYYCEYDVTDLLCVGENVIGVHLGSGWYGTKHSKNEHMPYWGDIKSAFRLDLEFGGGEVMTVRSDAKTARWARSYVTTDRMHAGETINAEYYHAGWDEPGYGGVEFAPCRAGERPLTFYRRYDFLPDRVIGTVEPKLIFKHGDKKIYDLGENRTGWAVIGYRVDHLDDVFMVRYGEEINDDMSLNWASSGGERVIQRDLFFNSTTRGDLELRPCFTWHAGRYVEVTGSAEMIRFDVVHTELKKTAEYKSSDDDLQWLFDSFVRTELMNVHGCIPSDCPHRERLGYTGDGQLSCRAVMRIFDARDMYKKWMRDVADSQDIVSGHVQHTAPFYGGGGGPAGWGGAMCIVPYAYYEIYGDDSLMREYYDNMLACVGYLLSHSEDGLVVREDEEGWCLGDWCVPTKENDLPDPLVNTYYFIRCCEAVRTASSLFGKGDGDYMDSLIKASKESLVRHYYDPATHSFAGGANGADAFAVMLGLGDAKTFDNLVDKYEALGEFDTGIFGTDVLLRALCENGRTDVARTLLTSHKPTSFYNMRSHGATTLWEYWNGDHSHSHPMFGAAVEYLIKYFNEA